MTFHGIVLTETQREHAFAIVDAFCDATEGLDEVARLVALAALYGSSCEACCLDRRRALALVEQMLARGGGVA